MLDSFIGVWNVGPLKKLDLHEKFCSNPVTQGSTRSMFFSDSSSDDVLLSNGNSSLHLEESQVKLLTILVHLKDSFFSRLGGTMSRPLLPNICLRVST